MTFQDFILINSTPVIYTTIAFIQLDIHDKNVDLPDCLHQRFLISKFSLNVWFYLKLIHVNTTKINYLRH